MVSAGEVLEELVERAADRRRRTRSGKLQRGLQLELFADQPVPRDADRPLFDLLPEAYERPIIAPKGRGGRDLTKRPSI